MVRQRSQPKERLSWQEEIENDPEVKFLTREQEMELWPLAKAGDEAAKLKLLKSQWPLVWKISKSYAWTGQSFDDLIGWGMIGLLKAFEKFRTDSGNRFSTVAMLWVRQSIGYEASRFTFTCTVPFRFCEDSYHGKRGGESGKELLRQTMQRFNRQNNFTVSSGDGSECGVVEIASRDSDFEEVDKADGRSRNRCDRPSGNRRT